MDLFTRIRGDNVTNNLDLLIWSTNEKRNCKMWWAIVQQFHPHIIVAGCDLPCVSLPPVVSDDADDGSVEERLDYSLIYSTCQGSTGARFFLARNTELIRSRPPLFHSAIASCQMDVKNTHHVGVPPPESKNREVADSTSSKPTDESTGAALYRDTDGGDDGVLRVVMIHFAMPGCHHCDSSPEYLRIAASVAAAAGNRVILLGDSVRWPRPRRSL